MTYDPKTAIEGEDAAQLPKDTILDGTIISIDDGKVKDFVKNTDKWESFKKNIGEFVGNRKNIAKN